MLQLNHLFRKRIGFPENKNITFENVDEILEKTAKTIPFENLCIIKNNISDITEENVMKKVLIRNEGGLCYELNTILYLFLKENGYNVSLIRGVTYDQSTQNWAQTGRTHVTILLTNENQTYIVDTGFGGNLPLKPVPVNGEIVISENGEFRVKEVKSPHGDFMFEMKRKHKDDQWKTGYAFHSKEEVQDLSELDEVQKLIHESPYSPFNKNPLLTKLTTGGNVTLTDTSFTLSKDGKVMKEKIDSERFRELTKHHFDLHF